MIAILPILILCVVRGVNSTPQVETHPRCESCQEAFVVAERLVGCLKTSDQQESLRLRRIGSRWAPMIRLLPLERLESAAFNPAGLELTFDFDGSRRRVQAIPESSALGFRPGHRKIEEVRLPSVTLRIRSRVQVELEGDRLLGIRKGDLESPFGPFFVDLTVRTKWTEKRAVCVDKDYVLAALDEVGRPLLRNGQPQPLLADTWLVLKAWRTETEVALVACSR